MRGLLLLAIITLIGTVTAGPLVARAGVGERPRAAIVHGWLQRLPGLLAWFLLMLSLARGGLQVLAFSDPGAPIDPALASAVLTTGPWGNGWIATTAAAFILLALSWLFRSAPTRQRRTVALLTTIIVLAEAGMGHGVEATWQPAVLGRIVHASHLLGAGLWVGTLAVLAMAVVPNLQDDGDRPALARVIAGFSVYARSGALVLLLSGVVATWTYVTRVSDLWTAEWGQLLLAKLALLVGVAGIGFYNWKVITPALARDVAPATARLRRAMAVELVLALLLVAVTAVLVATALPGEGG